MQNEANAPRTWWRVKVGVGALLIALLFEHYLLARISTLFNVAEIYGQVLVLGGGLCTLWHSRLLRAGGGKLVTSGGLFALLRHPMYTGDAVLYLGLALMAPSAAAFILVAVGWLALVRQAAAEDVWLAARFGAPFTEWAGCTGRLLPVVRRTTPV